MKKEVAAARCALCNLAADKLGNTLRAAQAERHHHLLEFRTSAELGAHLKANNDAVWVASGGVDAVVTWWFGRKGGQTWVSRST